MHIDIRRLSALAYPDTDHKTRELISCDYFIDALADPELGLKIRERQPKDLDSALRIALQFEVWTKDSERLSQSIGKVQNVGKKVREFTQQGNQSKKQGKNANSDPRKEIDQQRKLIAEQNKLLENYNSRIGSETVCQTVCYTVRSHILSLHALTL